MQQQRRSTLVSLALVLGWPVAGGEIVYEFVDRADTRAAWVRVGSVTVKVLLNEYRIRFRQELSVGWAPGVVVVMWE